MSIIATAEELREATEYHQIKRDAKTNEELLKEWIEKFEKNAEKSIKEATKQGLYSCELFLPYQPARGEDYDIWNRSLVIEENGIRKDIRNWVKKQIPGCQVSYSSYAMPGKVGYYFTLEIEWAD